MMWKLVFLAVLAVGVADPLHDDYDAFANLYCKAKPAEEKIPEVGEALRTFGNCVKALFDPNAIAKEIEEATPNKAFGEIVKKHCAKSSQLKSCFNTMLPVITPCVPPGLLFNVKNRVTNLVDFACDNEGAEITSFLKEDGLQCINDRKQEVLINDCFSALSQNARRVVDLHGGRGSGVMAVTVEETCSIQDELMTCLVEKLKTCSNQTPGNVVDELRKKITCGLVKQDA